MSKAIEEWIKEIKNGCNVFSNIKGTPSLNDLLELKKSISDLNNLIAVEQEVCFLEKIAPSIDPQNADKPNSNGYDIYVSSNNINIVAELKGMLPCLKNGNFGPQQKDGIAADLKGLIEGKSKAQGNVSNFAKYMVMFDGTQSALENLLKNSSDFNLVQEAGKDYAQHRTTGMKIEIVYIKTQDPIPSNHINIDFKKF